MFARASKKFLIAGITALALSLAGGVAYAGCGYDAGWSYRHGNFDGSGGNYSCYGGGYDCHYEGYHHVRYYRDGCCGHDRYYGRDGYYRDGDGGGWRRDGDGRDGYGRDGHDGYGRDGDRRDGDGHGWYHDGQDHH
jgi:hypothetical protein